MEMLTTLIVLCGLQLAPVATRDVSYPPTAVAGAAVITLLDLQNGRVRAAEAAYGSEPFVAAAREALLAWVFAPSETRKLLAVTVFRTPHLFSQGSGEWSIKTGKALPGIPVPSLLSEPAYPANASGDGSVAIHLQIDSQGAVGEIRVLKPLGGLTAACVDAAKGWRFVPARTGDDPAVASDALAICVFRAPLVVKPPG